MASLQQCYRMRGMILHFFSHRMMYLNAVTLTGHVGSFEIVKVPSKKGHKAQVIAPQEASLLNLEDNSFFLKVTISIAINESYKSGNEWIEETHWFTTESWGRSALVIAKYISVGRLISVQGKLSTKVIEEQGWDGDKQEYCTMKRKITFIKAAPKGIVFLDKKPEPEPSKSTSTSRPIYLIR